VVALADGDGLADELHAVASMTKTLPIRKVLLDVDPGRFIVVVLLLVEISFDLHLCLVWVGSMGSDLVVAGPPVAGRLRASPSWRSTPGG